MTKAKTSSHKSTKLQYLVNVSFPAKFFKKGSHEKDVLKAAGRLSDSSGCGFFPSSHKDATRNHWWYFSSGAAAKKFMKKFDRLDLQGLKVQCSTESM